MYIILDTSALYRLSYKSASFVTLLEYLKHSEDQIAIPKLVFDELENHIKTTMNEIQQAIKKQLREVKLWTDENLPHPLSDKKSKEVISEYIQQVKTSLGHNMHVLKYPSITHEQLAKKSIARKKPFAESGNGYQDALIWESIIDLLTMTDDQIIFITNNTDDFFNGKDASLHNDLQHDLLEKGINPERVTCFKNVYEFVNKYIKPTMETLENIRLNLTIGRYTADDIRLTVLQELQSYPFQEDTFSNILDLPSLIADHIALDNIYDIEPLQVIDVYKLSNKDWLIEAKTKAECYFQFSMNTSDWYFMKHNKLNSDIQIYDDSSDDFIWASQDQEVLFTFSIIFNELSGVGTSLEINSVEPVYEGLPTEDD